MQRKEHKGDDFLRWMLLGYQENIQKILSGEGGGRGKEGEGKGKGILKYSKSSQCVHDRVWIL